MWPQKFRSCRCGSRIFIFSTLYFYILRALYGYPWRCHLNFDVLAQFSSIFVHYWKHPLWILRFLHVWKLGQFRFNIGTLLNPCFIFYSGFDKLLCYCLTLFAPSYVFVTVFLSFNGCIPFRVELWFAIHGTLI